MGYDLDGTFKLLEGTDVGLSDDVFSMDDIIKKLRALRDGRMPEFDMIKDEDILFHVHSFNLKEPRFFDKKHLTLSIYAEFHCGYVRPNLANYRVIIEVEGKINAEAFFEKF